MPLISLSVKQTQLQFKKYNEKGTAAEKINTNRLICANALKKDKDYESKDTGKM